MIVKLSDLVQAELTPLGRELSGRESSTFQGTLLALTRLFGDGNLRHAIVDDSIVVIDTGIQRSRTLTHDQHNRVLTAVKESPTLSIVEQFLLCTEARITFETQLIKGLEKYGASVDGNTFETYLDWLLHPLEESMDLLVYLTKIRSLEEFKDSSEHTQCRMLELQRLASVLTNVLGKILEEEKLRVSGPS